MRKCENTEMRKTQERMLRGSSESIWDGPRPFCEIEDDQDDAEWQPRAVLGHQMQMHSHRLKWRRHKPHWFLLFCLYNGKHQL